MCFRNFLFFSSFFFLFVRLPNRVWSSTLDFLTTTVLGEGSMTEELLKPLREGQLHPAQEGRPVKVLS